MSEAQNQRFLKVTFVRSDGFTQLLTVGPGESVLVGRDLVCDCRLEGRKVSRRHMRLSYRSEGRVIIQDNTSHNGTFVNNVRVMESVLVGGEVLTIGEWEGTVEFLEGQQVRRRTLPGVMPAIDTHGIPSGEDEFAEKTSTGQGPGLLPPPPVGGGDMPAVTPTGGTPLPRSALVGGGAASGGFDTFTDPSFARAGDEPPSAAPSDGLPPPPGTGGGAGTPPEYDTRVVDMRTVWRWDDSDVVSSEVSAETLRAVPVVDNPIVQRLTQSQTKLDFRKINEIADPSARKANIDGLALQLVFRVTEALHAATSMDQFLADMSDSLCSAARAKAVVVLLPDPSTGELVPRVVKNRRQDEQVHLSRTIIEHAINTRAAIATEDASADERFASGESVLRFDLKAVLAVPLTRAKDVIGAVYLTRDLPFSNTERDLVAALAHLIAMGLERSKLKEQIEREEQQRRTLERFHAPDVVRRLMMEEEQTRGHGLFLEPLNATVLFCDLSGFTSFCETHDAEVVGRLLNLYLGSMTEIVFSHGGTVDKYIGDAIMCIFGAPFMADDDAIRAVRCAVEMRTRFEELMGMESGELGQELKVHMGINTGPVVAGTVGSSLRMEYTALGDTVNIAARLESVAKAGQIVVGPSTAKLVEGIVDVISLGPISLKGRDEAVEVYEVPKPNGASAGSKSTRPNPFELSSTREDP